MTEAIKGLLRPATLEEFHDLLADLTWNTESKCWLPPIEWLINLWIHFEDEPIDIIDGEDIFFTPKIVAELLNRRHSFDQNYDDRYWDKFSDGVLADAFLNSLREHGFDVEHLQTNVDSPGFILPHERVVAWNDFFPPDSFTIVDLLVQWARITHPEFSVKNGSDFPIFADLLQEEGKEGWAERFRYYAGWSA
ncbi:hypothetical protein J8F10_19460 [Gemmata sp. G18]|uniref:DUF4253 domain-containing protein n=1 Tax=Gemmata palustris TaxID=2822762 RepID=A0ABS5BUP6_9BACT|nr:hypothetical protein [Gemmata palustris]MBP3957430.1 hypothetical protein [Gemmata palustris]